jgi:hypothetical protein
MSSLNAAIAYQKEHADDDRLPAVVVAIAVCYTTAVISVGLRILSRHLVKAKLQADDWLILIALVSHCSAA